mmetsp:Transcript_17855/g.53746  ORF Transcript_17855/g.53746 Transcript_17855/m.53746 type:complete len:351 (-) Transcript_17855:172-1224(-)
MAQGDGAALGVHLLHGDLEVLHGHRRLRGKGFIDLVNVNVLHLQARLLECSRDREGRADAHDVGVDAHAGKAPQPADDGEAHGLRGGAARQQDKRGAVRDLARIACVGGAVRLEGGLQLPETLQGGVSSRTFVGSHGHLGHFALLVLHSRRHRDDLRVEQLGLLRGNSLLVGVHRQLVLRLTRDVPLGSDILRGNAHGHHAGCCQIIVGNLRRELVHVHSSGHIVHRHRLHPAAKADVDDAGLDVRRDVCHCLQAAAALAVHRRERRLVGPVAQHLRHPRRRSASAGLQDVTDLDVANLLGVNLGALHDLLEERGKHVLAGRVLEGAALGLGHSRADRTADDHVVVSLRR